MSRRLIQRLRETSSWQTHVEQAAQGDNRPTYHNLTCHPLNSDSGTQKCSHTCTTTTHCAKSICTNTHIYFQKHTNIMVLPLVFVRDIEKRIAYLSLPSILEYSIRGLWSQLRTLGSWCIEFQAIFTVSCRDSIFWINIEKLIAVTLYFQNVSLENRSPPHLLYHFLLCIIKPFQRIWIPPPFHPMLTDQVQLHACFVLPPCLYMIQY